MLKTTTAVMVMVIMMIQSRRCICSMWVYLCFSWWTIYFHSIVGEAWKESIQPPAMENISWENSFNWDVIFSEVTWKPFMTWHVHAIPSFYYYYLCFRSPWFYPSGHKIYCALSKNLFFYACMFLYLISRNIILTPAFNTIEFETMYLKFGICALHSCTTFIIISYGHLMYK